MSQIKRAGKMSTKEVNDTKLNLLKFSRVASYVLYAFVFTAVIFLSLEFILQLFGANPLTPFVKFIYQGANSFLEPFRGIFPGRQITEASYFNAAALFAVVMYILFGIGVRSLIDYLTVKMMDYKTQLEKEEHRK